MICMFGCSTTIEDVQHKLFKLDKRVVKKFVFHCILYELARSFLFNFF